MKAFALLLRLDLSSLTFSSTVLQLYCSDSFVWNVQRLGFTGGVRKITAVILRVSSNEMIRQGEGVGGVTIRIFSGVDSSDFFFSGISHNFFLVLFSIWFCFSGRTKK